MGLSSQKSLSPLFARFLLLLGLAFFVVPAALAAPLVRGGVLKLDNWSFEKQGNVKLDGDWDVFYGALKDPAAFCAPIPPRPEGRMRLPDNWNGKLRPDGTRMKSFGAATYHVRVLHGPGLRVYAFKLLDMSSAYEIFVNGKSVASDGVTGMDAAHTRPSYRPHVATFSVDRDTLDIVLHVVNWVDNKGGPWKSIVLGTPSNVLDARERSLAFELFLFGGIMIIALFHLMLFLVMRRDMASLFFALTCMAMALRLSLTGERYLSHLLPQLPWLVSLRLEYLTMFLMPWVFALYLHKLFDLPTKGSLFLRINAWVFGTFSIIALITPVQVFSHIIPIAQPAVLGVIFWLIVICIRSLKKQPLEAVVILSGMVVVFAATLNDVLSDNRIINTIFILPFGLFVFIISQSALLSIRSARQFEKTEALSGRLKGLNTAMSRFVPYEFLRYLGRDSIIDIRLGDQVNKHMTAMFADIRAFAEISQTMSPQENFTFLNEYFRAVSPAVLASGGFIDKFAGDAMLALFPRSVDDALNSAAAMHRHVGDFNEMQNEPARRITLGIGLHCGYMMLGTIGHRRRMATTVVSDSVNLASRLEALTQYYGARTIFSESVLELAAAKEQFHFRELDLVQVPGRNEAVKIFELLDGLPEAEYEVKLRSRDDFEKGVIYYRSRDIRAAQSCFERVMDGTLFDKAAVMYRGRCEQLLRGGLPRNWNPVTLLAAKDPGVEES